MLLTKATHSAEFVRAHGLGVEFHVGRPLPDELIPFVRTVHLPYDNLNLAALDEAFRLRSIAELEHALETSLFPGVERMVVHTCGIEIDNGRRVGDHELMIRSLRELADFAARYKITLCVENMVLRQNLRRFGDLASEWLALPHEIGRGNVLLTLDSSHAASSAAIAADSTERLRRLDEFLSRPDLIGHVHWSDARLTHREVLFTDMHLVPGKGDLPREFHRRIKSLDCAKLLEQNSTDAEVGEGLDFIASL